MEKVERDVLSACMLTSDNMAVAIERGVTGAWFSEGGDVFDAITKLDKEWNERDSMIVLSPVIEKYKCYDVIDEIPEWAFDVEEFGTAIDVLASAYAKRRLIDTISVSHARLSSGDDPFDIAGSIVDIAEDVECMMDTKERTTEALIDESLEIDRTVAEGGRLGLPFPWMDFQRRTFGVPNRSVTPLAGRDGKGKSRLMTYLAGYWISSGYPILYFAFEDGANRFISNLSASRGEYDMFTIRRFHVPEDFMPNHERCMNSLKSFPIFVEDMPCTAERIVSMIARYKRKEGIVGVVIDGLKDIVPSGRSDSEVAQENHINSVLVRGSKKYDVAIVTVSHLNDIDDDKWISKRNIRGSKRQSQNARMVLMYQDVLPEKMRADYGAYDGEVALEAAKTSYGSPGIVVLKPEMEKGRFTEVKKDEMDT